VLIVGLRFLFGLLGQAVRILVGLVKYWDQFQWHALRTVVTLIVGGIAGALAAVLFPYGEQGGGGEITRLHRCRIRRGGLRRRRHGQIPAPAVARWTRERPTR